ncbi:unnamed protein product, partial [Prorocentrum cordatum]
VITSGNSFETHRMQREVQQLHAGQSEVSAVLENILLRVDPDALSRMKQEVRKTNSMKAMRTQRIGRQESKEPLDGRECEDTCASLARQSAQALRDENAALRERLRLTEAAIAKLSAEVGGRRGSPVELETLRV